MVGEDKQPKNQINLNPIRRLFENPQESLEPYIKKGQVVADLGSNKGYYTFALAECVARERPSRFLKLRKELGE